MAQDRRIIMKTSVLPTAQTSYAAVPGSLEEYGYWDIGGGGVSDSSLEGMKQSIDYSIEDYEDGDRI